MHPSSPAKLARHPAFFAAWLMSLLLVFALFESARDIEPKFGPHAQAVIGLPDGIAADDLDEVFSEDGLDGALLPFTSAGFAPSRTKQQGVQYSICAPAAAGDIERARGPPVLHA